MSAVATMRSLLISLVAVVIAAPGLRAESNLLEDSPFLPPNVSGAAAEGAEPLELRSIFRVGGVYQFSLFDKAKKESTWVTLNESGHSFVVKAYDPATETVTVEQQNRTYRLALKEARIVPMAVVAGPGQTGPNGVVRQGVLPGGARGMPGPVPIAVRGQGPTGAPTPMLTPEQLRNLEADINRRRELRRQAAASFTRPSGTQPTPPSPQR